MCRNEYASQVNYYTKYIQAHEGWTFVDIYADQGITGTSALKRDEFLRLMRDCRQGKIDRILVKSVSRFARNAQDCIEAVRELRQLGVTVYFEKEHILKAIDIDIVELTEFDDTFIRRIVEQVTILSKDKIEVRFIGGFSKVGDIPTK